MPPRHHYWTIILEGKPTAFRAHTQEELMPTLRQLQSRHPDAVLKWFARGRLWETQEQERAATLAKRRPAIPHTGERRPRDWRPGGEHKDPRDRFKVPRAEKRLRFAQNLRRDRSAVPEGSERPPRVDRPGQVNRPDRPARFDRSSRPPGSGEPQKNTDKYSKPPWKRDEGSKKEGQGRQRPRSGFQSRSPRSPGGRKPGGRKPGGGGGSR